MECYCKSVWCLSARSHVHVLRRVIPIKGPKVHFQLPFLPLFQKNAWSLSYFASLFPPFLFFFWNGQSSNSTGPTFLCQINLPLSICPNFSLFFLRFFWQIKAQLEIKKWSHPQVIMAQLSAWQVLEIPHLNHCRNKFKYGKVEGWILPFF